jgi:hypothetical protein
MEDKSTLAGSAKAAVSANMEQGNISAKSVEVLACVNTKKKKGDARNVKETASALMADKKTTAKSAEGQAFALTAGEGLSAKTVKFLRQPKCQPNQPSLQRQRLNRRRTGQGGRHPLPKRADSTRLS